MVNTELKYRTFDQLLDEVSIDFSTYSLENMIEPGQLIKVAQRVNYDLGLRINGTKEKIVSIEKRKAKCPDDFYVLNYAFLCGKYTVHSPVLHGRQTENVILSDCKKCGKPDAECTCEKTYTVECQNGENIYVQVIEKRKYETRIYEYFSPVKIVSSNHFENDCIHYAYIKNGFIYTNIEEGDLFISYQGNLEDDCGNLLVLDHPLINEYYEYAIKQRILENLYISGEDVVQKIQLIEKRTRDARNNALSLVNTPNFKEMYDMWKANRKAMNYKYYNMFKSYCG